MNTPSAVLFDLDDTIINVDADAAWKETCVRIATIEPALRSGDLFREVQAQRTWYWSDLERHRKGRLNVHLAREEIAAFALMRLGMRAPGLPALIASTYSALANERLAPFPRALETLQWFRSRRIPLGLITNGASKIQRWKIDRFQLASFFGVIVVEEEFGVGKPNPAVFQHALEILRVGARETWMVGDRLDWDIGPPQSLGIKGIWHDFRKQGLPPDSPVVPARIIHSISDLMGPELDIV